VGNKREPGQQSGFRWWRDLPSWLQALTGVFGLLILVAGGSGAAVALHSQGSGSGSGTGAASGGHPASPGHRQSGGPTSGGRSGASVWSGPISISGSSRGIDLDSRPPATGFNNLGFNGSILYSDSSSFQIATWTRSSTPSRDQCNSWAQNHPAIQQPAETGSGYCIITGQGHTAYLQATNINPAVAGGTLYANVITWNTAGSPGSSVPITEPAYYMLRHGPISISYAGSGIDLDSKRPASGANNPNNLGFNGTILYSDGSSFQIATWTSTSTPSRDQCNIWAQTHPASQQPAQTGARYCIITGQGHTAYLQITSINPAAGGTLNANVTVWAP
jgi:hypothetical protein